jgi:hypothetical protein
MFQRNKLPPSSELKSTSLGIGFTSYKEGGNENHGVDIKRGALSKTVGRNWNRKFWEVPIITFLLYGIHYTEN